MTFTRNEELLRVQNVYMRYGNTEVLSDVNVVINNLNCSVSSKITGQVVSFLGPSGAGKTQLLRIIAGLQKPTEGTVTIDPDQHPIVRGSVGVVFQRYPLFEHRTVISNLIVAGTLAGMKSNEAKDRGRYYLSQFELSDAEEKYPAELSGGMKQRVAICQQLIGLDGPKRHGTKTRLILMDEPFAALDPRNTNKVCKLVRTVADLHDTNTIIVVTHDLRAALSIADTLWVMGRDRDANGKVISGGKIVKEYDLVSAGLTWHPEIDTLPAFSEMERELSGMFQHL